MYEPKKQHWIESKQVNENLITQNLVQIEMAKEVIALCDKKIAEFPKEEKLPELVIKKSE